MNKTLDIRGEDDGSTVELNKRDLNFMLNMMSATCDGNFQPLVMKEWILKVKAQVNTKGSQS